MKKFIFMISLMLFVAITAQAEKEIIIENYKDGDTIRYPVPLMYGKVTSSAIDQIEVINISLNKKDPSYKIRTKVVGGKFKALTKLAPGENKIVLRRCSDDRIILGKDEQIGIKINYEPQTNPYKVRMVYFTDKTGNTTYHTPNPNDNQDYRSKFDTGLKLMQTFTAERLNDLGFGRKTFNVDCDTNGVAKVYIVKGSLSEEDYSYMERGRLYGKIHSEISKQLPKGKFTNLATVAFSKHDTNTQRNTAYTALGGGSLALFGGAIMYTWPNSLSNAQNALLDGTPIDTYNYAHDDIGRKAYWATATTTIGAALHEMGHAFGLPHSSDWRAIMTRGIDYMNRAFVLQDAPSTRNKKYVTFKDDQVAFFEPVSAAALVPSKFFALDEKKYRDKRAIKITYDSFLGEIKVKSETPIAFIGFEKAGKAKNFVQPSLKEKTKKYTCKIKDIEKQLPKLNKLQIRVIDEDGYMTAKSIYKDKKGEWENRR